MLLFEKSLDAEPYYRTALQTHMKRWIVLMYHKSMSQSIWLVHAPRELLRPGTCTVSRRGVPTGDISTSVVDKAYGLFAYSTFAMGVRPVVPPSSHST
jgi:hypothetical protein